MLAAVVGMFRESKVDHESFILRLLTLTLPFRLTSREKAVWNWKTRHPRHNWQREGEDRNHQGSLRLSLKRASLLPTQPHWGTVPDFDFQVNHLPDFDFPGHQVAAKTRARTGRRKGRRIRKSTAASKAPQSCTTAPHNILSTFCRFQLIGSIYYHI